MAGRSDSRRGGRAPIDDIAKGTFVHGLRRGATQEEAARAAGFSRGAFHRLRRREPEFHAMCEEAIEQSAGKRRFITGGNRRHLQLRRVRRVKFDEKRQEIFFGHFAGTCNIAESARAANVSEGTVFAHLAGDPGFAARFKATLPIAYARLEADVVARRIEGQRQLARIVPTGEPEPEFDRAMKLLARWERRDGTLGRRQAGPGRQQGCGFEEAMEALDRQLRNFGIPIVGEDGTDILPPEGDWRGGPEDEEDGAEGGEAA